MNKLTLLKQINQQLQYQPITDFIGTEFPVQIEKGSEAIRADLRTLIQTHLGVPVGEVKVDNIAGTIAKYGLLDLSFEVEAPIAFESDTGIQTLRKNGWVDEEADEAFKKEGLEFLKEMLQEIGDNRTYLKVYATTTTNQQQWFKEKAYLLRAFLKRKKLEPRPEDELLVFTVEDLCYTNYSGIWLWKYFYW